MCHLVFLPLLLGIAATAQTVPAPKIATPVAVELFTSQGCSSCPPADALVERLAKEPNTIILTRPVTYWDRLGWKDTLAREANTQLQQAYARRGGRGAAARGRGRGPWRARSAGGAARGGGRGGRGRGGRREGRGADVGGDSYPPPS